MTRIAIVGSVNFPSRHLVAEHVAGLPEGTVIVSGGALGVDTYAAEAAKAHGLGTIIHEADWGTYGRRAGPLRNEQIVADADRVVAFWNGKSRGTLNTIAIAVEAGRPVQIIGPTGEAVSLSDAMRAAEETGVLKALSAGREKYAAT